LRFQDVHPFHPFFVKEKVNVLAVYYILYLAQLFMLHSDKVGGFGWPPGARQLLEKNAIKIYNVIDGRGGWTDCEFGG
jgi:hypothetical protein